MPDEKFWLMETQFFKINNTMERQLRIIVSKR